MSAKGARTAALAALALVAPLAVTLYAWSVTSDNAHQRALKEFEVLADENEDAMQARMASYDYALIGAAAYYQGSQDVTRAEWRQYVETLNIRTQFPGINGVGIIEPVAEADRDALVLRMRADGAPDFEIHPDAPGRPLNVITYIEPIEINAPALGLNTGFEDNRVQAANLARDSGEPAITRKIILVQDNEQTPGFLMMRPAYRQDAPTDTPAQRAQALRAWIYAPFIASNLLERLTASQGETLHLRLYDGDTAAEENLIFDSAPPGAETANAAFTVSKQITVMQQNWLAVWTSTPEFERQHRAEQPFYVLVAGLSFTGLFALIVLLMSMRRTETIEWVLKEQKYAAPAAIFLIVCCGSLFLYVETKSREREFAAGLVRDQTEKIALLIATSTNDKLLALRRMALRWEVADGTPEDQWRADAANHIRQLPGLRAVEWIDDTYRIRLIEPLAGNEAALGLYILFDEERTRALQGAASSNRITITPPLDLTQGYRALIAYAPVRDDGEFAGFMAGIFASDQFFDAILTPEMVENFAITLDYDGEGFFTSQPEGAALVPDLSASRNVQISDTGWRLTVTPTRSLIQAERSSLPVLLLAAGILIALLLALTLRAILMSRVKSAYLAEFNELNTAIMSSSAYLIVATDVDGKVVLFNAAAERALGYSADEVIGTMTPDRWIDRGELAERSDELVRELGVRTPGGHEVLFAVVQREGVESRRWTFVRKNGERFPVNLTVTPLRDQRGRITGYLGVAEDITEVLARERALQESEETFRTAIEYAPIGMGLCAPDGKWLKVSPSLCRLFGYGEADMLANHITALLLEDDVAETADLIGQAARGEIGRFETEKRFYHRAGHLIWTAVNAAMVRDAEGAPKYFIVQIQDITERKEVERLKNEFISIVSHELRTPLTAIRGSVGLIVGTMAKDLPDKAVKLLNMAQDNCERLILLINDILDIDKIASGQMRFDMQRHKLTELIARSVEANHAYAQKFGVTLVAEPIDESLEVEADQDRLIQVMSNLLSNAAKFSPENGAVEISAGRRGDAVRICVTDHGQGIADEFKNRIFGKFAQADSSSTRAKGGTGLGLNISRQIVEHMGGDIGFESELGQGATFWVDLPLAGARPLDAPADPEQAPARKAG